MSTFGRNTTKQWARTALKLGLLLTDAKLWSDLGDQLRDRAGDAGDSMRQRYQDTSENLHRASDALRGRRDWLPAVGSFVCGIGVGIGVGMLFTPVSGEEARAVIRDKASDMKNRVSEATRFQARSSSRATGTDGD
jgi:hypothetical protein